MSEIIKSQVAEAKKSIKEITNLSISDDRAFSYLLLHYVFGHEYNDIVKDELVTDGNNDGGIDFVSFDEDESKVIVCQSKYTGELTYEQIITELSKMYRTIQDFKDPPDTGRYNVTLKKTLQNALDRLTDDNIDNIEYCIFTTAAIDSNTAMKKINKAQLEISADAVMIYTEEEIEKEIQSALTQLPTVKSESIKLDQANNYLQYKSDDMSGIQCNVSSSSIIQLYNKHGGKGLFDLNIRRYIRNKLVDTGVNRTLDNDRKNFWFLNNGIIIACKDFFVDGNTVKLTDFSIVNGGQTTHLIGTYKGTNKGEFYLPCKIVKMTDTKGDDDSSAHFFTRIAEATNSQKPIYPRDLKSNAPEMVQLQRMLKQEGIFLEIKRGEKPKKLKYSIKNDELGQALLSFVNQQPGTSRSNKKRIFEPAIYDKIFKVSYIKDPDKNAFIKDFIELNSRYTEIENKYKVSGLTPDETDILRNGKQTIFALMGVCYRLANEDLIVDDILSDPKSVVYKKFVYGTILSNYHKDDLEQKLSNLIKTIVGIVTDSYTNARDNQQTSSVSNFLKTDQKYYNDIVKKFAQSWRSMITGKELKACVDIFRR